MFKMLRKFADRPSRSAGFLSVVTARAMILLAIAASMLINDRAALGGDWTHLAGNPARHAVSVETAPVDLSTLRFVVDDVDFVHGAAPVVMGGKLYAHARVLRGDRVTGSKLVAVSTSDGSVAWQTDIGVGSYDSWASPACDPVSNSVVLGSDKTVYSLDAETGSIRWQTDTDKIIVNASPCIAEGKVFLPDYHQFGLDTKLYCFDIADGAVLWSAPLSTCGGASPAYHDDRVYVATSSYDFGRGAYNGGIACLDALTGEEEWHTKLGQSGNAFCGGVSFSSGHIYAASYNFYGPAVLVKLNAETGDIAWTTASERTDSIPVVADGKVFLSGGVDGYGSRPKLQAFADSNGSLLWETTMVGGWTHQPAFSDGKLYAGLIPSVGTFGAYRNLHVLDVSKHPSQNGFVVSSNWIAGGSPAVADGNVYSTGSGGLYAFGPPPGGDDVPGDVNGDRCVNISDLLTVRNQLGKVGSSIDPPKADCAPPAQADGIVNIADMLFVRNQLGEGGGCLQ